MRRIKTILVKVAEHLNKENIDYAVVGGLGVFFYGTPRSTMDIGFLMKVNKKDIKNIVNFLRDNDFFASEEDFKMALNEKSHCSMIDKKSSLRLDIKGVYNTMDKKTLENKRKITLQGTKIYIASPEDLIVNKLLFGSEQDIKDAKSIMIRQENLDENYVKKVSEIIGIWKDYRNLKKKIKKSLKEYS